MSTVGTVVLEVDDVPAAERFYRTLGVDAYVDLRPATEPSEGFRGYTLSLVCSQPANVDAIVDAAVVAGATPLKPAEKSFWGYGGVVRAPDGAIWTIAASSKKNRTPAAPVFDDIVLLLGVSDVKATKQFYVDHGFAVAKSYGGKYVELEAEPVKLSLYPRKAAAKNAGVSAEGSGSHRISVVSDRGVFTDPDGFVWVAA